jgi:hypothetical protein
VLLPQTWRQQSWQCGAHDGVFVQLQALVSRQDDDTSDKGPRSSSDASSSGSKAAGASSSSSSTVLNKTFFIRLRPNKPPS